LTHLDVRIEDSKTEDISLSSLFSSVAGEEGSEQQYGEQQQLKGEQQLQLGEQQQQQLTDTHPPATFSGVKTEDISLNLLISISLSSLFSIAAGEGSEQQLKEPLLRQQQLEDTHTLPQLPY
jgi:hypothetical protein